MNNTFYRKYSLELEMETVRRHREDGALIAAIGIEQVIALDGREGETARPVLRARRTWP